MEALIWIRLIAIVLLIVAHAMRHVQIDKVIPNTVVLADAGNPEPIKKEKLFLPTTVSEDSQKQQPLALHQGKADRPDLSTAVKATPRRQRKNSTNYERVKAYMDTHQSVSVRDVAKALDIGISTANKWM